MRASKQDLEAMAAGLAQPLIVNTEDVRATLAERETVAAAR